MNHNPLIWDHAAVRAAPLMQHMRLMVVWVVKPASIFLMFPIMVLAASTFAVVTGAPIVFGSLATTCLRPPASAPNRTSQQGTPHTTWLPLVNPESYCSNIVLRVTWSRGR